MASKGANPISLGVTAEGRQFDLPLEAITETFSVLAQKGAGKTYFAKRLCERLLVANTQVGFIDPVGVCWGLRLAQDGKKPGFDIPVLGGDHADHELPFDRGELIAQWMVETGASAILDLSLMRKGQAVRFVGEFAETLYRLKASSRSPMHILIDEVDAFCPQNIRGDGDRNWRPQRTVGAVEDLIRRGRARGIGATIISQRAAVVNKDILTQTSVLVALRTVSPQDQAAIKAWVQAHDTASRQAEMMSSLASLPTGEAWVWSPGWLNIFERVKFHPITTYDSSATPDAKTKATAAIPARNFSALDTLREKLAPPKPKTRTAQLPTPAPVLTKVQIPESDRIAKMQGAFIKKMQGRIDKHVATARALLNEAEAIAAEFHGGALLDLSKFATMQHHGEPSRAAGALGATAPLQPKTAVEASKPTSPTSNSNISDPQQKILNAMAEMEQMMNASCFRRGLVAMWMGLRVTGSYNKNLSDLQVEGYITYPAAGFLSLTEQGSDVAQVSGIQPTLAAFHDRWLSKVSGPQARILRQLMSIYPNVIRRDDLAQDMGLKVTGSFNGDISKLQSYLLVEYPSPGTLSASPNLYPEGLV